MAYVDPTDAVSGGTATADDYNVVTEDIRFLYARSEANTWSAVQGVRNTTQAIADDNEESIVFNVESFDVGGWFDGNDATFITPAAAIPDGATEIAVNIVASVEFDQDNAGQRRIKILKNGASAGSKQIDALAGGGTVIDIDRYITLEAGDEIEIAVWQDSGSSLDVTAALVAIVRQGVVS